MKFSTLFAAALATAPIVASAQTERDLDSHEHGSALLNIAVDGSAVIVELESPWDNLVGFEHAPSTDEQHALVDSALDILNEPGQLFSFIGTSCTIAEKTLESKLEDTDGHDEHHDEHDDKHGEKHDDDHEHDDEHAEGHDDDHDHDDEHAEKHDDDHGHGHDDHPDESSAHSSILALYNFSCEDTSKLSSMDVNILDIWSGFDELDVQLIGENGQSSMELTAGNTQIDITPVQ